MEEMHFFDLDYTLWITDSKLSVINKNKPEEVIYRIDPIHIPMMKTYWKKFNLPVHYNGKTWWLSEDIWEHIQRNNKNIELTDIGISDREWNSEELLSKKKDKTYYLMSNLDHLKNKWNISISFLTARSQEKAHTELLNDLKKRIYRRLKINVQRTFFVNNLDDTSNDDLTAGKKAKILLEHLIGHKIRRGKFVYLKQTTTNTVHFYDDNRKNIDASKNLQLLFESCLRNTDLEIKKEIVERVKNTQLNYITHQITNNEIELFQTDERKLLLPNMVETFENYTIL